MLYLVCLYWQTINFGIGTIICFLPIYFNSYLGWLHVVVRYVSMASLKLPNIVLVNDLHLCCDKSCTSSSYVESLSHNKTRRVYEYALVLVISDEDASIYIHT